MYNLIKELSYKIDNVANNVDHLQYFLNLTWTILGVIIAFLALVGLVLLRGFAKKEIDTRLKKVNTEIVQLQKETKTNNEKLNNMIESGVNSNGEYIRFSNGSQICFIRDKIHYIGSEPTLSSFTFPASFYTDRHSKIVANVTLNDADANNISYSIEGVDNSYIYLYIKKNFEEIQVPFEISIVALGRWKEYEN